MLAVPGGASDALDGYVNRLEADGWTKPPLRTFAVSGGFQSSFAPGRGMWCSADGFVNVTSVEIRGQSYLRLTTNDANRSICRSGDRGYPPEALHLPTLVAPQAARVLAGGGGGSDRSASSETPIETTLEVGVLSLWRLGPERLFADLRPGTPTEGVWSSIR